LLAASILGVGAALAVAAPAFAHTEVDVDPATAGATNALSHVCTGSQYMDRCTWLVCMLEGSQQPL